MLLLAAVAALIFGLVLLVVGAMTSDATLFISGFVVLIAGVAIGILALASRGPRAPDR